MVKKGTAQARGLRTPIQYNDTIDSRGFPVERCAAPEKTPVPQGTGVIMLRKGLLSSLSSLDCLDHHRDNLEQVAADAVVGN
ncbi:MAG: hypothetical protein KHW93_10320, partial [Butyricicoccus pullicaecorum]|nr:hypothetical protein [Butyricicoccus pullicaecorum]